MVDISVKNYTDGKVGTIKKGNKIILGKNE